MVEKIKLMLRNNRFLFLIYNYCMSLVIKCLKYLIKPKDNLILFVSYGGRYFNDSPRCIYEAMKKDKRFNNYELVWAFKNTSNFSDSIKKININSLKYFITTLQSRVWITNDAITRGLNYKGKKTYFFHTTHTALPKLCGFDAIGTKAFTVKSKKCFVDCVCSQSENETPFIESQFQINRDKIKLFGYPKNDNLVNIDNKKVQHIKGKLNIPNEKTIILYAPTFREGRSNLMNCNVDFAKWKSILGSKYIILYRTHPEMINSSNLEDFRGFVYDVSNYPENVDLMMISDILISDYSGIFFEFGVQTKPMFCFAYDYDQYVKDRGLYFDIRKDLPGGYLTEEELLKYIKYGDADKIMQKVNRFRHKYIQYYGNSTNLCLDEIYKNIK